MSFQKTEAFPALAAPTPKPQTKQGGTPFVWAKLVNGEKKDLATVEAEAKAKKEAAEKARLEQEAKRVEQRKSKNYAQNLCVKAVRQSLPKQTPFGLRKKKPDRKKRTKNTAEKTAGGQAT